MSRRRAAPKREILPDPKYHSEMVTEFVNHVMKKGKKSIAEKIIYGAIDGVSQRLKDQSKELLKSEEEGGEEVSGAGSVAIKLFRKAIDNVCPTVEVKSRRVGGSTYQVPVEVPAKRRVALAMRWLIEAAKKRGEKTMALRLAGEMVDAIQGRGTAVKKREDTHRMAMANQAFAHYRW